MDRIAGDHLKLWALSAIKVKDLGPEQKEVTDLRISNGAKYVKILRPEFQRSLVWKLSKANEFRDSLANGYPFGTLIFADEGVKSEKNSPVQHFRIIDGQQRTYWLYRMFERFFEEGWFTTDFNSDVELVAALANLEGALGLTSESRHLLIDAIRTPGVMDSAEKLSNQCLGLASAHGTATEQDSVIQLFSKAMSLYEFLQSRKRGFGDLEVPLLIIKEELRGDLADVFVKLNRPVPLERFDLYAAQWSGVKVNLDSRDVDQDLAQRLYQHALNRLQHGDVADAEGYEVEEQGPDSRTITLYEYFYALSQEIASRFPGTLGAIPSVENEIALHVASILFAGGIQNMSKLGERYPLRKGHVDLVEFPTALFNAAADIDSALNPYVNWDLGRSPNAQEPTNKNRQFNMALGLTQIASYLCSHISSTNKINDRELSPISSGLSAIKSQYKNSLPTWWLSDALTGVFKGSGSEVRIQAFDRTWKSPDNQHSPMLTPVPIDDLAANVKAYVEQTLEVDSTPLNRRLDHPAAGAILRLIYKHLSGQVMDDEKDHVIPFNRIKQSGLKYAASNHIANWMPLNKSDNASRGDKFWSDCIDDEDLSGRKSSIKSRLFVDPELASKHTLESDNRFKEFLVTRYNLMTAKLVDNLQHPDVEHRDINKVSKKFQINF